MDIRRFDLNLLTVLDALLVERSVTRAARRLHLTQPATSNALRRLREALGDPILIRDNGRMELTPRARSLVEPVQQALSAANRVVGANSTFDPATAELTVHLAVSEYVAFVLLPPLIEDLRLRAPRVRLVVQDVDKREPLSTLRSGKVDLVAAFVPDAPDDLYSRKLFTDCWICVTRKTDKGDRLTLRSFRNGPHISSPLQTGGSAFYVRKRLAERGIVRDIVVSTPHYLVIPSLVERTDLIVTMPERLARTLESRMPLTLHAHPVEMPDFTISMLWHPRSGGDPGHSWFRDRLIVASQRIDDTQSKRARKARRQVER